MAVNRRKILELHDFGEGLGKRGLSEVLGYSRNTVRKVIDRAGELGITREVLADPSTDVDAIFERAEVAAEAFAPIDFAYVARELDRRGANRKLLWTEYCRDCAATGARPYMYSRFCELYRHWAKASDVTARLVHKPGYAAQVDWALQVLTYNTQSTYAFSPGAC